MPKGHLVEMTIRTRKELTRTVAKRYTKASRTGKQALLDEFCTNTQYNRDYATSLLRAKARAGTGNQRKSPGRGKKTGRLPRYDAKTVRILVRVWKMFDRLCGKRLVVFIKTGLPAIRSVPFLHITPEQEALLSGSQPARRISCMGIATPGHPRV
ncbi:MAG: hypothetical protein A3J97_05740 [Spirochaetes bacterium RIFOXYC1_FULL_54_7]|nr:MAG: hypothetical protein A3J97_05740 [Spirochaetes bacterium RIFOXYC1_FULL_54_7]